MNTISDLRQRADMLRQQELARAMRHLSDSLTERESAIVQELTTRFMKKLLHTPTLRLKDAAAAGQGHVYAEALRYLFDLEGEYEDHHHRDASQQSGDDPDQRGDRTTAPALAKPGDNHRAHSHQG